jgi:hypothetical protein
MPSNAALLFKRKFTTSTQCPLTLAKPWGAAQPSLEFSRWQPLVGPSSMNQPYDVGDLMRNDKASSLEENMWMAVRGLIMTEGELPGRRF